MLKACFQEELGDLSPGISSSFLVEYINYVLWLNGSDFVIEEIYEDISSCHPVPQFGHFNKLQA